MLDDDNVNPVTMRYVIRAGELIILCLIAWFFSSIYLGLDGRSYAIAHQTIKYGLNLSYLIAGIFPIIYVIIEDRRIQHNNDASFFWYRLMECCSLILWGIAGWLVI